MRHTFASFLLAAGEPITYVSRQLGHRDSAITFRVYAHWLPDTRDRKGVDHLDESVPSVANACTTARGSTCLKPADPKNHSKNLVTQIFTSWNQIHGWLRRLERLRGAA